VDFEGIGIGVDAMSGDSNDVSFVVAIDIVGSNSSHRNFYSFRKNSADVFLSKARLCICSLSHADGSLSP